MGPSRTPLRCQWQLKSVGHSGGACAFVWRWSRLWKRSSPHPVPPLGVRERREPLAAVAEGLQEPKRQLRGWPMVSGGQSSLCAAGRRSGTAGSLSRAPPRQGPAPGCPHGPAWPCGARSPGVLRRFLRGWACGGVREGLSGPGR